jgi:hypothetical protein
MSNNAQPFKMIKLSNPQPVQLPWILSALGPFKAVWFYSELEEDRAVPHAKLTGLRLDFKPHRALDIGLSRTVMFNGDGRPSLDFFDYVNIFLARKENRSDPKLDNNQLAAIDASLLLPVDKYLPARSVKAYVDFTAEDESGGLPSVWGRLFGFQVYDIFHTGRTDFTFEYANNHVGIRPNAFYTHDIYLSGYTYKGRIIGHHMGTEAEDLYLRLSHYLNPDLLLNLAYDRQKHNLSGSPQPVIDRYDIDLTFFSAKNWYLTAGYRYENASNPSQSNNITFLTLTHEF